MRFDGQAEGVNPLLPLFDFLPHRCDLRDALSLVGIQRRDFGDFEHICVDGGSEDGTRDIIDKWIDRKARIHQIYEPDNGIFAAMNRGLNTAKGECPRVYPHASPRAVAHVAMTRRPVSGDPRSRKLTANFLPPSPPQRMLRPRRPRPRRWSRRG